MTLFTIGSAASGSNRSLAILGMLIITWLGGGALALLEELQTAPGKNLWASVGAGLGISAAITLMAYIVMSSHLAAITSIQPTTVEQLLQSAGAVAFTLTVFYFLIGLVSHRSGRRPRSGTTAGRDRALRQPQPRPGNYSPIAIVAYIALPIIVVVATISLNLQVIQADIVYKTGLQFDDAGSPQAAIPLLSGP